MSRSIVPASLRRRLAALKRGDPFANFLQARRERRAKPPEAAEVGPAFRPVLASTAGPHSLHRIRTQTIETATAILELSGIRYHRIFRWRDRDAVFVVHTANFEAALEAIERELPDETWHVTRQSPHAAAFFHAAADRDGHLLADATQGVQIEGWVPPASRRRPDDGVYPDGALVPPEPGPHSVPFVTPDDAERTADAFTFTAPIDAVYTWVDSADAQWRQRYRAALGGTTAELHAAAVDPVRFTSFDELRYSLRSIHTYADWVQTIFIVTDAQVPAWLDTTHPRIRVVDHREILDHPVFNSHAIESRLHRIPGLAEHYLYLNDDVFLGSEVFPETFFSSATIHNFVPSYLSLDERTSEPDDPPIMAAAKNGRDLLESRFGARVHFKMEHTVHPQQRSVIESLERAFPDVFDRVARSPLRHYTDISVASSLGHWYGFLTGRAVSTQLPVFYTNLTREDAPQQLDALYSLRRYTTFCLNFERGTGDWESAAEEMIAFLEKYFPDPAPWEKTPRS